MYHLRPEIVSLRSALQNLQFFSSELFANAAKAKRLLDCGDKWNTSEWPGRTPERPRCSDPAYGPEYTARQTGWPKLLDDLNENLADWWSAWHAAQQALDSLPPEVAANLDYLAGGPWQVVVRRELDTLAEWHYYSGPKDCGDRKYPADLSQLMRVVRDRPLPDWQDQLAQLHRFDDELRSLRGRHDLTSTTGATPESGADGELPESFVTLQQAAAMVNRSKRSLERLTRKSTFPRPKVRGSGGKPNEYGWSEMRTFLQKEYGRPLPERFPADRLRRA